jgi:hypothetical protein
VGQEDKRRSRERLLLLRASQADKNGFEQIWKSLQDAPAPGTPKPKS